MRALLYEAESNGKNQIVDYGVRLEKRSHYRPVLSRVINYALEQKDIGRAGVVSQFLAEYDPSEGPEDRHFDITLLEARFAANSLIRSPKMHELKIALELQGRINAEHAFMMGFHENADPAIAALYTEGVGYARVPAKALAEDTTTESTTATAA